MSKTRAKAYIRHPGYLLLLRRLNRNTPAEPLRNPPVFSTPALTMRFSTILAFLASVGLVAASPYATPQSGNALVARAAEGNVTLSKRSGCGSVGPLGTGHFKWWIVVSCTPGAEMTCQATDASGCVPGDASHIGSMEVDDPNDTFNVARGTNTNTLPFTCPSGGQIRCEANFNDNDDSPNYSLRVF
ncbi:hypothetical protein OH77DRAFT_32549 [Trametes cingulata]|nr:hypothetical protein OH77DRAFT_32549 [Trametes cingulata]